MSDFSLSYLDDLPFGRSEEDKSFGKFLITSNTLIPVSPSGTASFLGNAPTLMNYALPNPTLGIYDPLNLYIELLPDQHGKIQASASQPTANISPTLEGFDLRSFIDKAVSDFTRRQLRDGATPDRRKETTPAVEVLAEWDGYVEEIHKDYFVARMHGLRGLGVAGKDEEAEIPISDVDPADRDLLVLGGFFRLMIAYESPRIGPKRRYTTVQFRRLPAYTQRELDAAEREAEELFDAFQLDEDIRSASG